MGELKWNLRKKVELVMKILHWNTSEYEGFGLLAILEAMARGSLSRKMENLKAHKPRK